MTSQLPVVLPGGKIRAHWVLAFLPQDLLNERWISHMNCQDGTKACLPHRSIPLDSLQLGDETKVVKALQSSPSEAPSSLQFRAHCRDVFALQAF